MREDSLANQTDDAADENARADKERRAAGAGRVGFAFLSLRVCFGSRGADLFESLACHGAGRLFELNVVVHLASESIFLNLVQQRFITDAEIFRGLALVAEVCFQHALDLATFDDAQNAMSHV